MTTVSERPKRRAASSNINYKETTETESFESHDNFKNAKRPKKSGSSSSLSTSSNSRGHSTDAYTLNVKLAATASTNEMGEDQGAGLADDNLIPWNWQPPFKEEDYFSHHLDVKNCKIENNVLTTKDGFKLFKNDCIYMVSEPPGEPYYIGRILGFTKKDKNLTTKSASNYSFKMNWFYRPRDLNQKSSDSRLLYATMHSDSCPIQSFRGLVNLKHRSEITNLDEYRQQPNNFYFDKLFDRYMIKYYEILPTVKLVNLPPNYYKALNKRFPYVFVEIGRGKDLLSAPKNCEKCFQWCSSMDSVMCVNCENYYHMLCLDPPLMKKPQRGFGWSCAVCNKKIESKLNQERGEMLHTSSLSKLNSSRNASVDADDLYDNEGDSNEEKEEESIVEEAKQEIKEEVKHIPRYEELATLFLEKDKSLSLKQRRNLEEWPYRYLGMHVKLEDAMDLQDRPYARSASRLGSKHQLTGLQEWYGRAVQYYDPDETFVSSSSQMSAKKKKSSYKKKVSPSPSVPPTETEEEQKKLPIPEEFVKVERSEFPPWLQERPKGYVERGGDDTVTLIWKMPIEGENVKIALNEYIKRCSGIAKKLGLLPATPNFMDAILKNYLDENYDANAAYAKSAELTRDLLKEPTLEPDEVERFEEGVRKYGSELYPVYQEVKTKSSADIVRFYYLWKKTPKGHEIWDNYEGRAKNKLKNANKASSGTVDTVADSGDDSSYDSTKITRTKRICECKHCHTTESVQWFRVTGHNKAPADGDKPIIGLCLRCAKLWRRYALQWEEPMEVFKKNQQRGGNGWKRRIEYELLNDSESIIQARNKCLTTKRPAKLVSPVKLEDMGFKESERAKAGFSNSASKKTLEVKLNFKKQSADSKKLKEKLKKKEIVSSPPAPPVKKIYQVLPPLSSLALFENNPNYIYESPPIPESTFVAPLQLAQFPPEQRACSICRTNDNVNEVVICGNCGLNVHKTCYGISGKKLTSASAWNCDCCLNDLNPLYSTSYSCQLCSTRNTHFDQIIHGAPDQFPDALKPTSEDQWCHVMCSIFDKNAKFGSLNSNSPVMNVPKSLHENHTKLCSICGTTGGCVTKCEFCEDEFHVTCSQSYSNFFVGFLLQPCDIKDKACIKIQDYIYGIPKPALVCAKHFQTQPLPPQFVPLRVPGKRINHHAKSASQEQPLISLFIQDNMKNDDTTTSGLSLIPRPRTFANECVNCHTTKSIIFINTENKILCHSCYSNLTNPNYQTEKQNYENYAANAMSLLNLVNSPLPNMEAPEPLAEAIQKPFSKIRINDILS